MAKVENPTITYSEGPRGRGDYPDWWGAPKGTALSNERSAWVAGNIAQDAELRRSGFDPAEVRAGKTPATNRSARAALDRASAAALRHP